MKIGDFSGSWEGELLNYYKLYNHAVDQYIPIEKKNYTGRIFVPIETFLKGEE